MHEDIRDILKLVLGIVIPVASFATGLMAAKADPLWLTKHPRLLLRSLVIILLVVPVGVVLSMEVLGTPDVVKAALTIAVISIGIGPPAAFKQARAHQEVVAYEVGLNLTLLALALVYLPLAVAVHGAIFHHTVELGVGQVAGVVLLKAFIPMVLGLVAGRLFPKVVAPFAKVAGIVVTVVLLALVVLALIKTRHQLLGLGTTWLLCLGIVAARSPWVTSPAARSRRHAACWWRSAPCASPRWRCCWWPRRPAEKSSSRWSWRTCCAASCWWRSTRS